MNNTVLELENISYKYKNDLILNKVNLKISINIKYLRITGRKERKNVKNIFQNFANR